MPTVQMESQWPLVGQWPCESLGPTWNGWATPAFTLDQFRPIAAAMGYKEKQIDGHTQFRGEDECVEPDAGDGLYRTDGWVWDVVGQFYNDGRPMPANEAGIPFG